MNTTQAYGTVFIFWTDPVLKQLIEPCFVAYITFFVYILQHKA